VEITTTDPDSFIATLPEPQRSDMARLDSLISSVMKGQTRVMWEGKFWGGSEQRIIGYGDYTYEKSKKETLRWFIIGLAAQKSHISLYVNASDADGYLVKRYEDRLGKVKIGSAAVTFKSADDLDLEVLRELLELAKNG
jgi:hypothetical protein